MQVTYRGVPPPNGKLEFTLEAELGLQGVILRIQDGKILAVQSGVVKGEGELLLEKQSVMKKEFGSCSLPGTLELCEGISLREQPEAYMAAAAGS